MAKRKRNAIRNMKTQKRKALPEKRRPKNLTDGQRTYREHQKVIVTHSVGAIPIINRLLGKMRLHEFLTRHIEPEDSSTKVDTPRVVLLLVRNVLIAREPMYGVTEWTENFAPELFQLTSADLKHLNDDRVGRCLEKVFEANDTNLIMDLVTHVVREFDVRLDELHNDSTTVTFSGDYSSAKVEQDIAGVTAPAIIWGHNKDHRPDLKQLLYILTVSDDGGIPVYFQAASGNVTDDKTHQATWKILAELVQRPDFVYVADCKLATTENMNEIARLGGRFITVLPASRKEDTVFRKRLPEKPDQIAWREALRITDEDGTLQDVFRVCTEDHLSKEGYRLFWFHSRSKQESDGETRARRMQRATKELTDLRERLASPRTRFRTRAKVAEAVDKILGSRSVRDFLKVTIQDQQHETFRQQGRGRPSEKTKYTRVVKTRFDITWDLDGEQLKRAIDGDGVFPLITNIRDWTAEDVLRAYKRQPVIEKRFSQLKTDFCVAPVYLKNVPRIVGLLTVYFFALIVQSLLERELRNAMKSQDHESLPLYPEGRPCTRPTARKIIDVFEPIARHTISSTNGPTEVFHTELAPIHRTLLKLLNVPHKDYRHD